MPCMRWGGDVSFAASSPQGTGGGSGIWVCVKAWMQRWRFRCSSNLWDFKLNQMHQFFIGSHFSTVKTSPNKCWKCMSSRRQVSMERNADSWYYKRIKRVSGLVSLSTLHQLICIDRLSFLKDYCSGKMLNTNCWVSFLTFSLHILFWHSSGYPIFEKMHWNPSDKQKPVSNHP